MSSYGPQSKVAELIHAEKYRGPGESFEEAMTRIAAALCGRGASYKQVREILLEQRFLPAGRIQTAIGSTRVTTPYNCLDAGTRFITRDHGVIDLATAYEHGEVTLLDGNGDWQPAKINEFGIREMHAVRVTSGRISRTVHATPDHRWILEDGAETTTASLRRGDVLAYVHAPENDRCGQPEYWDGLAHGIIYGDGSAQRVGRYQIRLCGAKRCLEGPLPALSVTHPESAGGDPFVTIESEENLKALPLDKSPAYLRGFMVGWMATDGCVSEQPEVSICMGPDEVHWCRRWAPVAGWHPLGWSKLSEKTNFGTRGKESGNLRFDRASLSEECFLMKHHRERFRTRNARWRVAEVSRKVRTGMTYCPRVLSTSSFVLEGGIHTGQCYVSGTLEDSLSDGEGSISKRWAQAAKTMQLGGGIGYDFGTLRPRGASIRKLQSQSSGAVSWMSPFNALGLCISSAGHRRGAQMGVLPIWHPDVEEFIRAKQNETELTGFNVSLAVTDEFMHAVEADSTFDLRWGGQVYRTIQARNLWDMVMRSTWDWAEPGVLFIDRINGRNNLWYCEEIRATNPCIAAGTLVSTVDGFKPVECIKEGDCIATTLGSGRVKTIESHAQQPVFRMLLSDGTELRATASHIVHVARGKYFDNETRLDQLGIGDKVRLAPSLMPDREFRTTEMSRYSDRDYGLIVGAVIGDGCYTPKSKTIKIACNIKEETWIDVLSRKIPDSVVRRSTESCVVVESAQLRYDMDTTPLSRGYSHEKSLPLELLNSTEDFLAGFIDGLISTDGNVHMSKSNPMVRVSSTSKASLLMLKRALSCFGILARVYPERAKSPGTTRQIQGRDVTNRHQGYVLVVLGSGLRILHDRIGLSHPDKASRLRELVLRYSLTGCTWTASVVNIEPDGVADVYDLFEPESDTWLTDGVVNRGCGEQPLPPFGACLLGSFNLPKYLRESDAAYEFDLDLLRRDIGLVVPMMDRVIDVAVYPLYEQEKEAKSKRRMGLGVTGLANAGEALGYAYGSPNFLRFTEDVLRTLRDEAYRASAMLAEACGPFPLYDEDQYLMGENVRTLPEEIQTLIRTYGIRNSHLTSIAPTGTISLTADNVSSGIEPVYQTRVRRMVNTLDGPMEFELEDYGYAHLGVREPRTTDLVTAQEHVDVLATVTPYVDSAVSKTCNVSPDMPWSDFRELYMQAWRRGCKGCTTFNPGGKRFGILASADEGATCTIDPDTGKSTCE